MSSSQLDFMSKDKICYFEGSVSGWLVAFESDNNIRWK